MARNVHVDPTVLCDLGDAAEGREPFRGFGLGWRESESLAISPDVEEGFDYAMALKRARARGRKRLAQAAERTGNA